MQVVLADNSQQTGEKYKVNSDRVKEQAAIDGAICKCFF